MKQTDQSKVTSQQVAEYLSNHPVFFNEHLELLEEMSIPHPSGAATSLISKQLELSRVKYRQLETELTALIEIATDNDVSSNRMHELTLALVESKSIEELASKIDKVFSDCFLTDFSAVRIFKDDADAEALNQGVFVGNNNKNLALFKKLFDKNKSICGKPDLDQAKFLFDPSTASDIQSCAMIPLSISGLKGVVAIGSRDETRFHYSMGNLFLTQMSESISARLQTLLAS